ncbi:hypothetical protein [Aurantiacibacter hainanensis]|uniref:hypothetical protein n=1 Tax=Aurantiacibacter hainanensis TaxID=3076114 RepID=UPI0030C77743
MTWRPLPLLVLAALALPAAALAQDRADATHVDEFTIEPGSRSAQQSGVEQLGERETLVPTQQEPGPPEIDPREVGNSTRGAIDQLSPVTADTGSPQLSERDASRNLETAAVSSSADSRPETAQDIEGVDRRDPGQETTGAASCEAILERRAQEFAAAEAPRMSAEQALLAGQGESAEILAPFSSDLRTRLAQDNPDANARSNQELASVVFQQNAALAEAPDNLEEVSELLQALDFVIPQSGP